jgi:hypothetical protein
MKVTVLKYLKTFKPHGSCGTGYSEPDIFEVTFDNGETVHMAVDTWYRPASMIHEEFLSAIDWQQFKGVLVDNVEEAYRMYVDEAIAHKLFPYTKEQLGLND